MLFFGPLSLSLPLDRALHSATVFLKTQFRPALAPNSDDYLHRKAVEFNPAPFSFLFNLTEDNADTVAQPATSCLFHRRIFGRGKKEKKGHAGLALRIFQSSPISLSMVSR